jgi:hypothetical protein
MDRDQIQVDTRTLMGILCMSNHMSNTVCPTTVHCAIACARRHPNTPLVHQTILDYHESIIREGK